MEMDLSGFVTPEQNFRGIYQLSDRLDRQQAMERNRAAQEAQRKSATSKFLLDYLDPKQHLTGTAYDPQIIKGFGDLMQKGVELARQGADNNTLMMVLGQDVSKLSEYSSKAKVLNEKIKQGIQGLKQYKGYDTAKLEEEARRTAFYNPDGTLKDITEVDPEQDWIRETIRLFPEKVTTDFDLDEFVKNSSKFTETKDVTTYTPSGAMSKQRKKITSPSWLVSDTDERGAVTGLVPKYQIALDGGKPIMHEFTDEKGKKVKAPVRLLDEQLFKSILASNPGIADWLRGQVKSRIQEYSTESGEQIDLNSPQAMMVGRAIMYDELNRRRSYSMEDVEVQNKPSTYMIKNYMGIGSGSSDSDKKINNTYAIINEAAQKARDEKKPHLEVNQLPVDAQKVLLDYARALSGMNDLGQQDIKLIKEDDDSVSLYYSEEVPNKKLKNKFMGKIDFKSVNLKTQPGAEEKRKALKEAAAEEERRKKKQGTSGSGSSGYSGTGDWKKRGKKIK